MAENFDSHLDALRIQKMGQEAIIRKEEVTQESVQNSVESDANNARFPANLMRGRFVPLEKHAKEVKAEQKESEEVEETAIGQVESIEEIAGQFERKNPEMQTRSLLALRVRISANDSDQEILQKVLEAYPDPSLADEALDFLIATSSPELSQKILQVKKNYHATYGKEIAAGKNIAEQTKQFSQLGLGTPTGLRDLYRDLVLNPREPAALFTELTNTYSFEKLKTVVAFVLHSLGSDLKSKGPSIEPGELTRLLSETKSMQAILGVYRFFKLRMRLIQSSFDREGLDLPPHVTFESLSKLFIKFLLERFPGAEKIYQMGTALGLQDELLAEAIIFSQMRDGLRQISPRFFKSEQHRQDVLSMFLDVLQQIDDKIDEEIEEAEDEEDEMEKKIQ